MPPGILRSLRAAAVLGAAVLGVAGSAAAASKSPWERDWVSLPTAEDHQKAEAGIVRAEGELLRAVVRCAVLDSGELSDCRVIQETPPGHGLGAALMSLTPKYRRKPPGRSDPREIDIVDAIFEIDTAPGWIKRPTPDDLLAVFPTAALKRGIDGEAIINCVLTVQGALKDCVTIDESPAGYGFGGAAVALTPQFLMKPALKDGAPVEATMTIPIKFKTFGGGMILRGKKVAPANMAWQEAPSFSDVVAAYPEKARAERKAGRATLSCDMSREGRLKGCDVATVSPRGYGFEAAAKSLARQFALAVPTEEDRKATREIVVHMPFTFDPAMLEDAKPVVGKPSWAAIPPGDRLRAAFADLKLTQTARVTLRCVVQPAGFVADCEVVSEDPAGSGVGAAALTLAPSFRLSTWTTEGLPVVGGAVSIPLRYEPGPAVEEAPE